MNWMRVILFWGKMAHRQIPEQKSLPVQSQYFLTGCMRLNFEKYGTLSHSQTETLACLSRVFPGKWI
jgi:hypothetical protein